MIHSGWRCLSPSVGCACSWPSSAEPRDILQKGLGEWRRRWLWRWRPLGTPSCERHVCHSGLAECLQERKKLNITRICCDHEESPPPLHLAKDFSFMLLWNSPKFSKWFLVSSTSNVLTIQCCVWCSGEWCDIWCSFLHLALLLFARTPCGTWLCSSVGL